MRMGGEGVHARCALLLEEACQGGDKQVSLNVQEADPDGRVIPRQKTLKVKIPAGMRGSPRPSPAPVAGGAPDTCASQPLTSSATQPTATAVIT